MLPQGPARPLRAQLIVSSAIALVMGAGILVNTTVILRAAETLAQSPIAAPAQTTTDKALDKEKLTPIRPIRRVGPNDWPTAKSQPDKSQEPAKAEAKKEPPKPAATAQQAQKPAPKQDQAQNQETKKPTETTGGAVHDDPLTKTPTAPAQTFQPAETKPGQTPPAQNAQNQPAQNTQPAQNAPSEPAQKTADGKESFASIRLGTDAAGKVAVNADQERQIGAVLRKERVRPSEDINFSVGIGASVPASFRIGAVSSDIVDILPQFRGYSFFATREEIVIVEPRERKIVALIPVAVAATAKAKEPKEPEKVRERREPRSSTTRSRETASVPTRRTFTEDVPRGRVPAYRGDLPVTMRDVTVGSRVYDDDGGVPVRVYRDRGYGSRTYVVPSERRVILEPMD